MQQIKQAALADEFSDHIEVRLSLLIYTHSHVKHDVWMAQLVKHLNFFDEVLQSFPRHIPAPELFDSNFSAKPASFENISVASSADQVISWINYELLELNEKVKSVLA